MRRSVRLLLLLACLVAVALGGSAGAEPVSEIPELRLTGVVDPFMASYVKDGIARANRDGNPAILITIDTPGGLDSSMRQIVQAILSSKVPVVCYTSPSGARAASAGTFIMLACPVAAMAPGTNIGAAHPVGVAGAIEQQKVTNDAAAFIRSLAERWDRNADWAERAVRQSVSVSAEEAVRMQVVDLLAPSTGVLLNTQVGHCRGAVTNDRLRTGLLRQQFAVPGVCSATVVERNLGLGAWILHGLISPNFAFLFFYAGLGLIVLELLHPGISVPGILGTVCLITAFISFGLLPVQLVGVVLLVASAAFFLLELKHPGIGAPTIGGVTTLILGGLYLFNPDVPSARVSIWVLGVVAGALTLFFGFVVRAVVEAKRLPPAAGPAEMAGEDGVAVTDLTPNGQVRARRETWTARSAGPDIHAGSSVRVIGMEGLRLIVEPLAQEEIKPKAPARAKRAATKGGRS